MTAFVKSFTSEKIWVVLLYPKGSIFLIPVINLSPSLKKKNIKNAEILIFSIRSGIRISILCRNPKIEEAIDPKTLGKAIVTPYFKDISLKKIISKPIILFHIFRQVSENDYLSHLLLWDFLWGKMKSSLASKIIAKRYTYRKLDDLNIVSNEFENILKTDLKK